MRAARRFAPLAALWLCGCASLTGSSAQPVAVTAVCEGAIVTGVMCTLKNDKGQWQLEAPGRVLIQKSYADLSVRCEKAGSRGQASFVSKSNDGAWGNLLIGGVIGYAVDSGGAGFDYPGQVPVVLSSPCPAPDDRISTTPKA